jgi:transcriptional regulator
MYAPKNFEEKRTDILHSLVRQHPLATLITQGAAGLVVDHIPMVLSPEPEPFGTLFGHVARANPVWREFSDSIEAVAVFQGPETYISPSWYPGKREHGKVVPTWNYAVVHARGVPRAITDPAWLLRHVGDLTDENESHREAPWKLTDAPEGFAENLVRAIVGIEIPIRELSGKWKMSQNRPAADQAGVAEGLERQDDANARATAGLVRERIR